VARLCRNPIPIIAPTVLLTGALYWWMAVRSSANHVSAPVAVTTDTKSKASEPTAPASTNGTQEIPIAGHVISHRVADESASTLDDPVELWKKVQRGNTGAEIKLAKLYLEGTRVAQSCDQARVLLLAAAKKQSAEARNLLAGAYPQRCR
jgi:hypothetical protein